MNLAEKGLWDRIRSAMIPDDEVPEGAISKGVVR